MAAVVDPVAEGSMTAADFALAKAKETGQPYELTSARTENSDTWALPTGKWSVKRHGTTVRVRRADGWVATDPTLQFAADGKVKPKASAVAIAFSGGGTGPLLTGVKNGRTLSFTWPQALPKPTLAANVATYANVLPDVDLQLKAEVEGFSQLLVVKTAAAAKHPDLATLRFKLDTVGLNVTKNATTGLLTATNPAGEIIFTSPNPVMWDSTTTTGGAAQAPARAAAVASADAGTTDAPSDVFVTPSGAKNAQMPTTLTGGNLEIKPDQALLASTETKYPVYIDPSVAWGERQNWSWVYRSWENNSYWNTKEDVRVGYESETNGLSRSFFQLDTSAVKGAQVSKATFRIKETWSWSCTPKRVELWTTNSISPKTTWNNQPVRRNQLDGFDAAKGWGDACPAGNLEFNATAGVQEAASNGWSSMTVGLYAGNESDVYHWKRFDPKTVTLEIEYNNPPNTPADLGISPWVPCEQGGSVGNTMVRLYATASDRDAGNLNTEFQIFKAGQSTNPVTQTIPSNNGKFATWTVPDASLPDGNYTWRARTTDQDGAQSGWSQTCKFTVDRTNPADAPKITSTKFPDGSKGWPQGTGQAREEGDFTLSSNAADGVTWYGYYTDWDPQVKSTTVAPGASFTAKLTPPGAGPHFVYAFSQDAAGNRSDTNVYQFYAARKDAEDGPHDVNGDGNRDIWSNDLFGSLLTYHGQGNGAFSASIASPESFTGSQVATLGRGDDDAYNDLLALQKRPGMTSKTLWVYSNQDGQGTVGNPTEKNVGQAKNNHWSDAEQIIAPGDLNYDGVPDVLVKQGDKLWAYYNSYWGNLDDEKDPVLVGGTDWNKYTVVAPGDVNGDKIPDLWLRDNATGDVYSTHGKKGLDESQVVDLASWGTQTRTKVHSGVSQSGYPQVGSSGDLNGDQIPDLWARQADNTMVGWPGKRTADGSTVGSFTAQFKLDGVPGARIPSGTTLASGQEFPSGNSKLLMKSDGNLVMLSKDGKQLWATGTAGNPGATARMQSDGSFIVLSADAKTTLWSTKTNTPGAYAVLQPRGVLVLYTPSGQSLWSSGSQSRPDYNGDGYTDMALRDANGDFWIYPGTGGTGTNTFGTRYWAGNGWWRDHWTNAYITDFNNDGYTDLVGRDRFGDLYLYPGTGRTGTETFGNPILIGTGWFTYVDLGFGDINGDGRTDVIGRDSGGSMWVYSHNGGTGTQALNARVFIGNGWGTTDWSAFRIGDLNQDNKADILGQRTNGRLYLYPNASSDDALSFASPSVVGEGWWPGEWTPYVSDLDNDGAPGQVGLTRTGELYGYFASGRTYLGNGLTGYDVLF
ncbi:FG-GAP-like repeat-containing protein [Streptomyces sp. NRRL F-4474]|uniref:FG-GAP-like repeat-containing protein n=1 Tax=Streptomyces sp. NRRL F-4474 TaxID=1463851 RepID=UPI00068E365E|nr:FG-GAP-like repeat-containing protein [Streptomyces sp. NRRL F-4474]